MSKGIRGTGKSDDISKRKVIVTSKPNKDVSEESKIRPSQGHQVVSSPIALGGESPSEVPSQSNQRQAQAQAQAQAKAQARAQAQAQQTQAQYHAQPKKAAAPKTTPESSGGAELGHGDSSGGGQGKNASGGRINYLTVLALIGVAGLGYFSYQNHQTTQALKVSLENQVTTVSSLDSSLKTAQEQQLKSFQKNEENLSQLDSQMRSQANRLNEIGGNQDWKLHEARYLLALAVERLQATNDVKAVAELLQSADQRMASVADPRAITVRQAIANDLSTLKRAPQPDIQGLWAKLGALSSHLETLSFYSFEDPSKRPQINEEGELSSLPSSQDESGWKASLKNSWQELKGLVKVREFDPQELSIVLSGNEQQYLKASLKLLIEQARLALINHDKSVFVGSLEDLEKWLGEYFVQDNNLKIALQEIAAIRQSNIEYASLDITSSLVTLDRVINNEPAPAKPKLTVAPEPEPEPEPELAPEPGPELELENEQTEQEIEPGIESGDSEEVSPDTAGGASL